MKGFDTVQKPLKHSYGILNLEDIPVRFGTTLGTQES